MKEFVCSSLCSVFSERKSAWKFILKKGKNGWKGQFHDVIFLNWGCLDQNGNNDKISLVSLYKENIRVHWNSNVNFVISVIGDDRNMLKHIA